MKIDLSRKAAFIVSMALLLSPACAAFATYAVSATGSVTAPASDTFSYAGYGDNEYGHYKVFFYSLTSPDQYLKHLLIWARVDWSKPQNSDSGQYQSELMLFHIDCKAVTYAISSRVFLTADGKILKRMDLTPAEYMYETMPTPDNDVFVKGKSSVELGAAVQLMDGC
ncbi:MAG TPA: hypothetical protein VGO35_10150 [Gammaproteobacteria bacterium]|jgi:hypothetical protein|nr:hypothetical protein [Gammaproteobacteria bacterium]